MIMAGSSDSRVSKTTLPGIARRFQFFGSVRFSSFGSRFLFKSQEPSSVPSSVPRTGSGTVLGSVPGFYEESPLFPQYPLFLSIFVDIP